MCHFFSCKTEFDNEKSSAKPDPDSSQKKRTGRGGGGTSGAHNSKTMKDNKGSTNNENNAYDDIFDEANDLFVTDDCDKSLSEESNSFGSGHY